jgi:hypothetical protein
MALARAAKEGIVTRAESLSTSTDWKNTGQEFKRLQEEWKSAGRAGKPDDDLLWAKFQAAKQRFFDARSKHFEQLDRDKSTAKATKERLIVRARMLEAYGDTRAAQSEMRSLVDQWRQAGRADKSDEDRLWQQFNAVRERLRERANREHQQRKTERIQRLQDSKFRKQSQRSQLWQRIFDAERQLGEMMSKPSPSFNNPRWYEINNRRQASISRKNEQISSLRSRLSDVERSLVDIEQKLREALSS